LKEKVKRPSETMQMELHNVEYQMAIKDTDHCLIHKAACEVYKQGETILSLYIAEFKPSRLENIGHNILGIHWQIRKLQITSLERSCFQTRNCIVSQQT